MYDEEANVERTVAAAKQALGPAQPLEIVIVDDGSTDRTRTLAEALSASDPSVRVLTHARNRGRGAALRTGFAGARGLFIAAIDADLSYDPALILKMLEELEDDPALDIVIASPYVRGGGLENVPAGRRLLSRWGNRLLARAFGADIATVTGVFRTYRAEVLKEIELHSEGKRIHLEILAKALASGFRAKEIPATLRARTGGMSKTKLAATSWDHLLFAFEQRPTLLFGVLGALLTLSAAAIGIYLLVVFFQGGLNPERPLVNLAAVLFVVGIQFFVLGFISTQITSLRKEMYRSQRLARRLLQREEEHTPH